MSAIQTADRILTACERVLSNIATTMMFLIMIIVVADVALRYFFNAPLAWSYELISLYLMVGLFFFSLSDTLRANAHVSVDLLQNYMSPRVRHFTEIIGYACSSIVFAGIVYITTERTYISWQGGDVVAGSIAWPTWLSSLAVPIGSALMLLRMIFRFIGHTLSFVQNRSVIELPPVSGSEGVE